jgi:hypothetical protein
MVEILNDGTNVLRKDRPRNPAPNGAKDKGYDPADDNVDEVKAHVEKNPDQAKAVLAAERKGENRKTLVEWLESRGDDDKDDSGLL